MNETIYLLKVFSESIKDPIPRDPIFQPLVCV